MRADGTDDGTLVHSTTASDGDDLMVRICD
jgi:hypothetical protein